MIFNQFLMSSAHVTITKDISGGIEYMQAAPGDRITIQLIWKQYVDSITDDLGNSVPYIETELATGNKSVTFICPNIGARIFVA